MPTDDDDPDAPYVLEPVDPSELDAPPTPPPSPTIGVVLGSNLAYEAVSHASALVVQDVGSLVRQFTAISTAALAVVTEKIVQTEGTDPNWIQTFKDLTENLSAIGKVYGDVGAYAAIVKSYFVPGAAPPPAPTTTTRASRSSGR